MGSSIARVRTAGEEAPLFALFGHVDEIGLIVTHVDDNGILFFRGLGGWTAEVLVGQPSRSSRAEAGFRASSRRNGTCGGARRRRRSRCDTSISTSGLTTATTRLRPCASAIPPCWPRPPVSLLNGRLMSRALDNRLGAYIALEIARGVAAAGDARCNVACRHGPGGGRRLHGRAHDGVRAPPRPGDRRGRHGRDRRAGRRARGAGRAAARRRRVAAAGPGRRSAHLRAPPRHGGGRGHPLVRRGDAGPVAHGRRRRAAVAQEFAPASCRFRRATCTRQARSWTPATWRRASPCSRPSPAASTRPSGSRFPAASLET